MNILRKQTYTIDLTLGEIVAALKASRPDQLVIQALPNYGLDMSLEKNGSGVRITWNKEEPAAAYGAAWPASSAVVPYDGA